MRHFLLLFLLTSSLLAHAQFTYRINQEIPVLNASEETLPLAWAGGINASQFSTIDLNGDNIEDLLLFDRMANKPIAFLRQDHQYVYAPEYETLFPTDVLNWILLRDFNCDGKKDIFTGDIFGMKVYKNTTPPGGLLSWEPYLFYNEDSDHKSIPLLTSTFGQKGNLQMMYDDLPAIADADGDGDLDIFNFRFSGAGTIEFHQNRSMEEYGTCDSLEFVRVTAKWGGITECNCGEFAFNNETCPTGGRVKHAAGKSLQLFDGNADGKLDLVMSEATCTRLYILLNNGDVYTPDVTSSELYPLATPVNMVIFPSAFYEDVDFDGVKDFISTPNIYRNDYFSSDLKQTVWFYKNYGTDAAPDLGFLQTNFLQQDMIDVGDNAVPAFADYDHDGDLDMFISQYNSENIAAGIYLYENTGTKTEPSFRLVTNNYLNLRARELYNIKIQFAHFNNDSRLDLVFTANSFLTGTNNLYYALNEGDDGFQFTTLARHSFELLSPENVNMTDVNQDGLTDILVGRSTGNLEYWRNTGSDFVLEDDSYLGFGPGILTQSLATDVGDLDADGHADLVIGDLYGQVSIISNFRDSKSDMNDAISTIIFNPLLDKYEQRNLGGRIWPTVANLFGTNRPVIVVGNILGGVSVLTHTAPDGGSEAPLITLHPNPTTTEKGVKIFASQNGTGRIFSANGQLVKEGIAVTANETRLLNLHGYAPGLYILQLTIGNKTYVKRFVIFG